MDENMKSKINELSLLKKLHSNDNLQVANKLLEIEQL